MTLRWKVGRALGCWSLALAATVWAQPQQAGNVAGGAPQPSRNWFESLALDVGFAEERAGWAVDEARRQQAARALRDMGVDPAECARLGPVAPGEKVTAGLPLLEHCAAYNSPGSAQQIRIEWKASAVLFAGIVALALLIGSGGLVFALRERRKLQEMAHGRPGDPSLGNLRSAAKRRTAVLPSKVRIKFGLARGKNRPLR